MPKQCRDPKDCPGYRECKDNLSSWLFFLTAIIATIALRIIEPLNNFDPIFGKIAWYIGVSGFFIFFMYKFIVDHKRSKLIKKQDIANKIRYNRKLNHDDYELLNGVLCRLLSNKDKLNFFFISFFSVLALLIAIYFDLMH